MNNMELIGVPECSNPLAPPWLRGAWPLDPEHRQRYCEYCLTVTLTASQTSLNNKIQIDGDSCFIWRLTGVTVTTADDGEPYMRFRDHLGKYMSATALRCASFGQGQNSTGFATAFEVPAGAEIRVDLYERAAAAARINIVLRGFKRYR